MQGLTAFATLLHGMSEAEVLNQESSSTAMVVD